MDTLWIAAPIAGILALAFAFLRAAQIEKADAGNDRMQRISGIIHRGAKAFLFSQYRILVVFAAVLFLAIGLGLGSWATALCFLVGVVFSTAAGYCGMHVATKANVRTAAAAQNNGLNAALQVAFRGGSVMGMCVAGLGLIGCSLIYMITKDTGVLFGFSLGASSVALFARVGGGIYTKAADVGADLVGKVESHIPEDDPRNPATIADNVGDNVGDVAGMGADLFESYVGSLVSAVTLGITYHGMKGVVMPLVISGFGLVASILGTLFVKSKNDADPHKALKAGSYASAVLVAVSTVVMSLVLFDGVGVAVSVIGGLLAGLLIGFFTEFYTSDKYKSVREIARQAKTGGATVMISGLGIGMRSTGLPILFICGAIMTAYYSAGLYGVAMASVGMLSTLGITVAVDAYGPIADNAGGIAQMSELPPTVRAITDKLDSVGNTTAAMGKGFAIGSAALTALALFISYAQTVGLSIIDVLDPNVITGLFIGAMLPFFFSALTMGSVSKAAYKMIAEVRRQFHEIAGILDGTGEPDYDNCIAIATNAALHEMVLPGVLAVVVPLAVGFLLGTTALGGTIAGAVVSGVLMAIFMSNAGGAWDNAKKFIEEGNYGGKGSEPHSAAVIGDTVGDPLKDTSGPSINILIKLMAVVSLVFGPLLAEYGGLLFRLK